MIAKIIEYENYAESKDDYISETITESWTPQAIECWKLQQKCSACSIGLGNYSFECQMPKIVKILLEKFVFSKD